jgi:hypothetical protein
MESGVFKSVEGRRVTPSADILSEIRRAFATVRRASAILVPRGREQHLPARRALDDRRLVSQRLHRVGTPPCTFVEPGGPRDPRLGRLARHDWRRRRGWKGGWMEGCVDRRRWRRRERRRRRDHVPAEANHDPLLGSGRCRRRGNADANHLIRPIATLVRRAPASEGAAAFMVVPGREPVHGAARNALGDRLAGLNGLEGDGTASGSLIGSESAHQRTWTAAFRTHVRSPRSRTRRAAPRSNGTRSSRVLPRRSQSRCRVRPAR